MPSYQQRLHHVIPGGAHTYSRGDDQYPSNAPSILARGEGAYVWDADGRRYLDYGMGLRAVTLGYANERVNKAAYRQMANGVNLTRASVMELEAAEMMVGLVPSADMVKFAKNGSTVTTAALKLARAYTGRPFVCVPRQHPFFSYDDWFIGTTQVQRGIPAQHYSTTLVFDYGDLDSLTALFDAHSGEIAAVILEPATTIGPCPAVCDRSRQIGVCCATCSNVSQNFLHETKALCHDRGALFILDEMITGFRWDLPGAQTYFGIEPDLSTFGKGIANGFAVSALMGKREIMRLGGIDVEGMERTFLISTTHGAEMSSLGALVEVVKIYQECDVIGHLWRYGQQLFDGINEVSRSHGLGEYVYMDGGFASMQYVTKDRSGQVSLPYRTLFAQELIARGVLMPWVAISFAHGDAELQTTLSAVDHALTVYAKALDEGIDQYLVGPPVKPVFRRYN